MNSAFRCVALASLCLALPGAFLDASAQVPQPPPSQISFHFERPGMEVPEYTFILHEDGTGTYEASVPDRAAKQNAVRYGQPSGPPPVTRIALSYTLPAALTQTLFAEIRGARLNSGCASKQKNVANTGMKTLTYAGPEASTQCSFNYTQNKSVTALAETFQAMSFTLSTGRALAYDERFDRLSLDHEMNALVAAAKDGRAQGLSLIAPELQSLIDNVQVMERVRRNASVLLDKAVPAP